MKGHILCKASKKTQNIVPCLLQQKKENMGKISPKFSLFNLKNAPNSQHGDNKLLDYTKFFLKSQHFFWKNFKNFQIFTCKMIISHLQRNKQTFFQKFFETAYQPDFKRSCFDIWNIKTSIKADSRMAIHISFAHLVLSYTKVTMAVCADCIRP